MSFGETIVIKGVDGSQASLSIGDNQISPDEGSEEVIDICFSNGDENTTSGYIKLTVGYLNFDEDGGAADGISDEVDRKSTRLNSSHSGESRMPSSA